jgi:hypothetical protein
MENVTSDVVARPIPQPVTSSVAPQRPTIVTRPDQPQSGQDSRGGESQGRSWEQADAKRPLTFQDSLLSSTTLSSLREALDRLSGDRYSASTDSKSVQRKGSGKDGGQDQASTIRAKGQSENPSDDPRTVVQRRREDSGSDSRDNGGDGYYGPDWSGSGQLLEASRRAVAIYQQSVSVSPDSPIAGRAERLDLVA